MSDGPHRELSAEQVEYRVVYGTDVGSLSKVLTEFAAAGFRVVPGGTASGGEVRGVYYLLERRTMR